MDRRRFVIGTAATALAAGPAFAQETFPSHAITIINAFPPGGINDIVTRPLAAAMEPIVKQPVVVEAKPGAAGQIGAQFVASAKPDGYTLLSHNTGISGYAEVDKLFGRPVKTSRADFIPLARIVADPVLLLVNEQQPYTGLKEFIESAKAHPDSLVFSSGGLYGASHLPLAYLEMKTGPLHLRHLPTAGVARHRDHSRQQRPVTTQSVSATLPPSKPASCARSPFSAPSARSCAGCADPRSWATTWNTICGSEFSRPKAQPDIVTSLRAAIGKRRNRTSSIHARQCRPGA
jgi:tripartite-type tricarboxylate transporter receptor subunit TctC